MSVARQSLVVPLSISSEELLRLYSGKARHVVAVAENGQTVRFPAGILRKLVTHDGVQGRFQIDFDTDGKFMNITELVSDC